LTIDGCNLSRYHHCRDSRACVGPERDRSGGACCMEDPKPGTTAPQVVSRRRKHLPGAKAEALGVTSLDGDSVGFKRVAGRNAPRHEFGRDVDIDGTGEVSADLMEQDHATAAGSELIVEL
jgi:hypothetical protein